MYQSARGAHSSRRLDEATTSAEYGRQIRLHIKMKLYYFVFIRTDDVGVCVWEGVRALESTCQKTDFVSHDNCENIQYSNSVS